MLISPETGVSLYRSMRRIREVQLRIESLYHLDRMKTPVHLCIGQEAVAVGVCACLRKGDYISSNHRGHGHYLAKGGDLKRLIAELHCRETGCSKGRGGSMHLVDPSVGHMGSSSIVGGGIPIGTGLGLAAMAEKKGRVSAVFFGDGAADEGVLYESVNFAILRKLPVLFVYENNRFSVCSRVESRSAGENVFLAAPSERLFAAAVDGNDVQEVYGAAEYAVSRARRDEGPSFIECRTYRLRGHAGAGSDVSLGYRSAEEVAGWEERCPVEAFRRVLISRGWMTPEDDGEMKRAIAQEIDEAFLFAEESPLPRKDDLRKHLFAE